eukprot:CCRYP_003579-RA/>CCRYP_003579-RA protein AED:0.17 eAED:0.17 QI:704/1/1/1/1/1/3/3690/763
MMVEQTNEFCLETCLWIVWGILSGEYTKKPRPSLLLQATEIVKNALSEYEDRPSIIILGLAILSDVATLHVITEVDSLIPAIFYLKSKYREHEILNAEANKFLSNICKTSDIAALIENAYAEIDIPIMACSTSIHLIYKVSLLTGNSEFSLEDLKDAVKTWHQSRRDFNLAAKILFLLSSKAKVYIKSSEKVRNILLAKAQHCKWSTFCCFSIEYIKDVMENTTSMELQQYACMSLSHVAVLAHNLNLASLDIATTLAAIVEAQDFGVKQLHATWALLTLDCQLPPSLLSDLASCSINAILEHLGSRTDIVSAGVAVLSIISLRSRPLLQGLDEKTIENMIEVVIKVMYECLDQTGNNPHIILFGLHMLRICSAVPSLHDAIVKHGGIVAVIDGMTVNHDDAAIQEDGCKILRSLSSIKLETKIGLIEGDAVDAILNILVTYGGGTNARLLSDAFEILSYLSISKATRSFITSQGGLILITNSMRALSEDATIQERGLRALANLASDIDDSIIEMSDMSSTITSSLGNHIAEITIQQVGLSLVRNLSLRSNAVKDQVVASGCLESVISAMTLHMTNTKIISLSLSILFNLSNKDQCMCILCDTNTLQLISHALMINLQCQKTQIVGIKVLCLLSSLDEIANGSKFLEAVVFAMLFHFSSEAIQLSGCKLLTRCSFHQQSETDPSDLDSMIAEAIISAMDNFPLRVKIQEHAIDAMENMSIHENFMVALQSNSSRAIHAIHNAMTVSSSMETFERGGDIIGKLQ